MNVFLSVFVGIFFLLEKKKPNRELCYLIQPPVGAQRQQVIVLSLEDLTCLTGREKKKAVLCDITADTIFVITSNRL